MTDRDLADAAWAEFTKTTDSYPSWKRKGFPSSSHWAKGKALLDQIDVAPLPPPPPPPPTLAGVFVSPTGSDTGGDGSQGKPYATHARAQKAMRLGGPQTCYLRGGPYPVGVSETLTASGAPTTTYGLRLTAADSGQTYQAFPGEKPILDCSAVKVGIAIDGASNVTIDGLELFGFKWVGVGVHGGEHFYEIWPATTPQAKGNTIRNCIQRNGSDDTTPIFGYGGAPIFCIGNMPNLTISHNAIHDAPTGGISIAAGNAGGAGNLNALGIVYNAVTSVCQKITDAGAIYVQDTYANSTGIGIFDNFVRDCAVGRGIYLDDGTSNAELDGNYIAGLFSIACTIHGGRNINWHNDVIDAATPGATILRVQKSSVVTLMDGLKFTGNTFIYNAVRVYWIDSGVTVDTSGNTLNPHPYPTLSGPWGPPGYVIPAGTPPSYA